MAKRIKKVLPPWIQGAKTVNKQKMLVVHMNDGELEGLDNLQGYPSIDPKTGIREYSALAPIVEMPEIQELFHHVADEIEQRGKISPDLQKIYEFAKKKSLPYREAPEEKHDPLAAIEETGRGGDTKLALIPLNLAFLLIELRHVPSINPKTGLLEFMMHRPQNNPHGGGGQNRVGSNMSQNRQNSMPVTNAVINSSSGNASNIYGRSSGIDLPSILNIAGTIADSFLGDRNYSYNSGGFSGLGSSGGSHSQRGVGNFGIGREGLLAGLTSSFSGGFGPGGIYGNISGSNSGSNSGNNYSKSQTETRSIPEKTSGPADPKPPIGWGDIGNGLLKYGLPALQTGLAYIGSQKKHKEDQERANQHNREIEAKRKEIGFDIPLGEIKPRKRVANPAFYDNPNQEPAFFDEGPANYARGGLVKSYSQGTLVRGKGKGQDDLIKTSVPDGSYIIDASSTSAFGDGSSEAGANVLKHFEQKIKKRLPAPILTKVKREVSKAKQVPVWLSDSEYKFDPVTVAALGDGSNEKGAALLKQMVIKLRKHKISKGDDLPPKAKDPFYYIGERHA